MRAIIVAANINIASKILSMCKTRGRLLCWSFISSASGFVGPNNVAIPNKHRTINILAQGRPSGGVDDDDIMSSQNSHVLEATTTHREELLDLQTHTLRKSPADTLASLSKACERLGVDTWDVYGDFGESDAEQSYLRQFEAEVAHHFGKEDGVFCLSGGMAQSIALLINARRHASATLDDDVVGTEKTLAFACHPTSHLLLHENNHFSEFLGMEAAVISPNPGSTKGIDNIQYDPEALKEDGCYGMEPVRLSHVQNLFSSMDGSALATPALTYPNLKPINSTDISTLILELPHREIGGKLTPWEEVEEISHLCKKSGIKYHCDGARIFEASVGYGHKSVTETAKPFTSIYVSFYKGLGAISGAMLLGDAEFCSEARVWLRRMGGNLYSVLPYAISSWDGFRRYCLSGDAHTVDEGTDYNQSQLLNRVYDNKVFGNRQTKLARVLELLVANTKIASIVHFDPVKPETNMVHGYLRMSYDECMAALKSVEHGSGIRVLRSCSGSINKFNDQKFGCR
ncbi:hypothetical protein ACHAXR_002755, partial [Thalassiosira sp. AJA248-18]